MARSSLSSSSLSDSSKAGSRGTTRTAEETPGPARANAGGPAGTLADRLRRRRLELGWTQQELAVRVSSSQAVIQKIENGKSLRPRIIEDVARCLGVSPSWLVYGTGVSTDLDFEAIELARSWQSLKEPHRSAMRCAILEMARHGGVRTQ
ncbi:MAG: helix-turn-helix domain-containing protein [Gammaproteobacteria bacterium]